MLLQMAECPWHTSNISLYTYILQFLWPFIQHGGLDCLSEEWKAIFHGILASENSMTIRIMGSQRARHDWVFHFINSFYILAIVNKSTGKGNGSNSGYLQVDLISFEYLPRSSWPSFFIRSSAFWFFKEPHTSISVLYHFINFHQQSWNFLRLHTLTNTS